MNLFSRRKTVSRFARTRISAAALALAVSACGGGGSGHQGGLLTDSSAPAGATTLLTGSIVKGPVAGASVCAYALTTSGKGGLVACSVSAGDASYRIDLQGYVGDVLVEATGGTYTDEATGVPGVALSAPLVAVGSVAPGTNSLVATPLTSLAFHATHASGDLSIRAYQAQSSTLRDLLGLPANVDLSRSQPIVATSQENAYGKALVAVSRMLQQGSSLQGIVQASDLQATAHQIKACGEPLSIDLQAEILVGAGTEGAAALIDVTGPNAAWRSGLGSSNLVFGDACSVVENSPERVILSCSSSAVADDVRFIAGTSSNSYAFDTTGSTAGVQILAIGDRISVSAGPMHLAATADVRIDSSGPVAIQNISAGGAITVNAPFVNPCLSLAPAGPIAVRPPISDLPGPQPPVIQSIGAKFPTSLSAGAPLPAPSSSPGSGNVSISSGGSLQGFSISGVPPQTSVK